MDEDRRVYLTQDDASVQTFGADMFCGAKPSGVEEAAPTNQQAVRKGSESPPNGVATAEGGESSGSPD
jgi:hypothetical protein